MYQDILDALELNDSISALQAVLKHISEGPMTEELAVLSSTVYLAIGKEDMARNFIRQGLILNSKNYELWLILGETYANHNINQAYLCYENALFYCENPSDSAVIESFITEASKHKDFHVVPSSIVILSYNSLDFTRDCIDSIRRTCPKSAYEIVIIDNASQDGSVDFLKSQSDIILQCNKENSGFPGGCNQGIHLAAVENDILLLNNDTVLAENSLFWLRMGLYENEYVGSTGSISNCVSNFQKVDWPCKSIDEWLTQARFQNLPMASCYERRHYLVGFAVLIKRTVLEKVGYLDERFSPGQFEDNDLGYRLIEAGYDNILCLNSFIFHHGAGGGKNSEKWNALFDRNQKLIHEKWNIPSGLYIQGEDILCHILHQYKASSSFRLLEVNCGIGSRLLKVQNQFPDAQLYGIDMVDSCYRLIPRGINFIPAKDGHINLPFPKDFFDYVVFIFMDQVFDDPKHIQDSILSTLQPKYKAFNVTFDLNPSNPQFFVDEISY